MKVRLFFFMCFFPLLLLGNSKILFIASYHPSFPTFNDQLAGINNAIQSENVEVDYEYLDAKRFPNREMESYHKAILNQKMKRIKYDGILVGDDAALHFVLANQNELFRRIPIVFFGVNDQELAFKQDSNLFVTGIIEQISAKETISLMNTLQPEAKKIYVVYDDMISGTANKKTVAQLYRLFPAKQFVELNISKYSFSEFEMVVKKISANDAILFLSGYVDKNDIRLGFYQILERITENASAPVYHLWKHGIGQGFLGGYVISHYHQAQKATRILLDALKHDNIMKRRVSKHSLNQPIFDESLLKQYGINKTLLSDDTIFVNCTESFCHRNKTAIMVGLAVFFVLLIPLFMLIRTIIKIKETKRILRANQNKLQTFISHSPIEVFSYLCDKGKKANFTDRNINFFHSSGIFKTIIQTETEELSDKILEQIKMTQTKSPICKQYTTILDEKECYFTVTTVKLSDIEIIGYFEDTTKSHNANEQIQRNLEEMKTLNEDLSQGQQLLQSLIQAVPVGIGLITNRKLEWTNSYLQKILNVEPQNLIANFPDSYFSTTILSKFNQTLLDSVYSKQVRQIELPWTTNNKGTKTLLFGFSSFAVDSDHVVFTVMDLTKEKQAMQTVQIQNQFMQSVLESIIHPFYVIDIETYRVILHNSQKIYNDNEHTLCYKKLYNLNTKCNADFCPIEKIKKEKKPVHFEHSFMVENEHRVYEIHFYPIFEKDNSVQKMIEYCIDITDQKDYENRLNHSQKMEAVGLLAGGIAHDFNNLLTVINGYSNMILEENIEQEIKNDIQEIANAGERASNLTRQLLAFSKKQIISPKKIYIDSLLESIAKLLHRLIPEDISLSFHLNSEHAVFADKSQLEQILVNLVVNAKDAFPHISTKMKEITITTNFHPNYHFELHNTRSDAIEITIQDNGKGIPEEIQSKIFEPFFTTKESGKGTGLGLATIYGIISQNKAEITLNSLENKGTTFSIFWPAYHKEEITEKTITKTTLENKIHRVLLAEDSERLRDLTVKMLVRAKLNVDSFSNGQDAFEAFQKDGKYDLVITDVIMPKMNGKELADHIHEIDPNLKILFISGYTSNFLTERGITPDQVYFLYKPYTYNTLMEKINDIFST